MYKLVTNDSSTYALACLPFEGMLEKRGVQKKVLCLAFGPEVDTLAAVKEICCDELKTAVLTVYDNEVQVREEVDYTVLEQITTATVTNEVGEEVEVLMAKMSKATTIAAQISALEEEVSTLASANKTLTNKVGELETANNELKETMETVVAFDQNLTTNTEDIAVIKKTLLMVDEDTLDLDGLKAHRVAMSKVNLSDYLGSHTVTSTAHAGVTAEYSMTQEKQTQLMAMVMMATINPEYQPSWNASGEVCTYDWTLNELQALAADIEAVVRPLVAKQQTLEVEIMRAATIDDVKAIDITF